MAVSCNGKPLPVKTVHHLHTPAQRRRGLIGRAALPADEVLIFHFSESGRWSCAIHSCLVQFPFAALWLDQEGQVVDLRARVRPWRLLILPRRPARTLIEAHPDLMKRIKLGDKLAWESEAVA